jgi:hypothetical protein
LTVFYLTEQSVRAAQSAPSRQLSLLAEAS